MMTDKCNRPDCDGVYYTESVWAKSGSEPGKRVSRTYCGTCGFNPDGELVFIREHPELVIEVANEDGYSAVMNIPDSMFNAMLDKGPVSTKVTFAVEASAEFKELTESFRELAETVRTLQRGGVDFGLAKKRAPFDPGDTNIGLQLGKVYIETTDDGRADGTRAFLPDGTELKGVISIQFDKIEFGKFVTATFELAVAPTTIATYPMLGLETVKLAASIYGFDLVSKKSVAGDWQDISTAPLDGTLFIGCSFDPARPHEPTRMRWGVAARSVEGYVCNEGDAWWINESATYLVPCPTHWKPLAEEAADGH